VATIRRRGSTWQVQIRRHGHAPLSRTFRLKPDAELWARQKEAQLDRGELPVDTRVLRSHTLADLLERYGATIVPRKRSADRERYMLRVILRHPMARLSLHRLTPAEVARYRDDRLAAVSGDTVRRELAIVRHCLEVARKEWGFVLPSNPVHQVKLPRPNSPRERRAAVGELERLLSACEATSCRWLPAIIQLAVETGMRRSELLAMRWDDVNLGARTVLLRNTKNGLPRTVPLSVLALKIIRHMPRFGEMVFGVSANAVRLAWERLKRRAQVSDLRFHDLRHEAVSRFFEKGLNMPEVAAISGHRDPRMLMRYTHPKAEAIAIKLGHERHHLDAPATPEQPKRGRKERPLAGVGNAPTGKRK
jgi:integrase